MNMIGPGIFLLLILPLLRICYKMIAATSHSSLILLKYRNPKLRRSCSRYPSSHRLVFSLRLVRSCGSLLAVTRVWEPETHVEVLSESRSDIDLEEEIFEFMTKSSNPERFPSKEELIAAGRMDLVDGISKQGGWLALGWGLDEEDENDERNFRQTSGEDGANGSSEFAASSGRPAERVTEIESTGIEGILCGLEKERNLSFGVGQRRKEDELRAPLNVFSGNDISNQSTSLTASQDLFNDSGGAHFQNGSITDNSTSEICNGSHTWRIWSSQRAGSPLAEFEAIERPEDHSPLGDVTDKMYEVAQGSYGASGPGEKLDTEDKQNIKQQISSHLQQLEQELSSVLNLIRSKAHPDTSHKVKGNYPKDLESLSDVLEFQQTEAMKTEDQLRSMRAKLAVLEGKIAMEIIEAQRLVEEKQKKIDNAQKAFSLLRTASIVWPNSATEVLLAGSFDGWTSQRRMHKSKSGIFSLNLKLYPGRYEIKFIVDGVWRVDPLRPVVHSNGHENNLLIVS
ncbi:hypothetical protein H6P81_015873 [Aristolochia fimbriata]|uniref:AMP-activated protein kinase glycogen-binding domain-containing protein n=1 Tax=Aristolochia fimbriata TaxID=158543 RepID=A0AAV7E6S3_ARIFI|nr:hypothetical protein H6P81_015873 [Aristolochia fimbriata]